MKVAWKVSAVLAAGLLPVPTAALWSLKSMAFDFPLFGQRLLEASSPPHRNSDTKSVAIIGAGAAGSSTAYFLQKFAAEQGIKVDLTIYERSDYVGGRSTTVNVYDDERVPVELGASIFVEVNEILVNATKEFGLGIRQFTAAEDGETEVLGIWNGDEFVFTQVESSSSWWDTAKLLWKYGLAPIRTQRLMQSTVGKFLNLYHAPAFPFDSLSARVEELGLLGVTSLTGAQYLEANNIRGAFANDIIQASTRVNYANNLDRIHGLETMVCMAISGAMQVEGGNWQIFDRMIQASGARLELNSTVTSIGRVEGGRYTVATPDGSGVFDDVVLTAPWQFSDITMQDGLVDKLPDEIPYVHLHVTLFTSPRRLNLSFFNLPAGSTTPTTVLTTLGPDEDGAAGVGKAGFFSISTLRSTTNPKTGAKEYAYKIFSPEKVTSEFLSGILGAEVPADLDELHSGTHDVVTWFYPHAWYSYPVELPRVTFEETRLAAGLYYTSAMESFISTMETNSLMGRNVARLIADAYGRVPVGDVDGRSEEEQEEQSQIPGALCSSTARGEI